MEKVSDTRPLRDCSYGLYVVTSKFEGKGNGQIANSVFQVTAEPPRVAVGINKENYSHGLIRSSGRFGVSILADNTPLDFIARFGFKSGRDFDKLDGMDVQKSDSGVPLVIDNALSSFEAKVLSETDTGTHTLFVADYTEGYVIKEGLPLTYKAYHDQKGRSPRTAPTYVAEENTEKKGDETMQKYVCGVCGYVYDPEDGDPDNDIPAGTAFEDLPDDWTCPVCGASKDQFSPE